MTVTSADTPAINNSTPPKEHARVAIDLGAESCRVSLLRWDGGVPRIELVHRIPNSPERQDGSLRWPFDRILSGLEEGLHKAAAAAPEEIASIAVDGWAVDYVRLDAAGRPLGNPFCYRDERTLAAKERADRLVNPEWAFRHAGAQPMRINTIYQLLADRDVGIDPRAPWVNLPEYILYWLGGRRVAEFTNATHTGLVDLATGGWSLELLDRLDIPAESLPPIVPAGTIVGRLAGPLAALAAFRDTQLIVPACHDTASAIAGIPTNLGGAAYICSGTWSLVGTVIGMPITTAEAMNSGFTNQGAAGGAFCFHTNVNGMWILKQCLGAWETDGRPFDLRDLIAQAAECDCRGIIPVDAPALLLGGNMPELINHELRKLGCEPIENRAGSEPRFARVIFESLASRYASVFRDLEKMLGSSIRRIHILGGGSQNQLLTRLTAHYSGLPVETGNVESSTIGNFAVQMATAEAAGARLDRTAIRRWAQRLTESSASTTHA